MSSENIGREYDTLPSQQSISELQDAISLIVEDEDRVEPSATCSASISNADEDLYCNDKPSCAAAAIINYKTRVNNELNDDKKLTDCFGTPELVQETRIHNINEFAVHLKFKSSMNTN